MAGRSRLPHPYSPDRDDPCGHYPVSPEAEYAECMSARLRVTLTGGSEQYLEVDGDARELLLLIAAGNVGRRWLPLESRAGVVRVDAIVCMAIEGTAEDVEHERDRLDAQLMELAGFPKMDDADVYGFERRGR
jgi:hypothetical protein